MRFRGFRITKLGAALLGGIKFRLVGMILLAVVPLIGVHIFELYQDYQQRIGAAHTKAIEIARGGAEHYKAAILEAQALLEVVSQVPEVISGSPDNCRSFLERAGRNRAWANGLWVIGMDGRVVCTTVPDGVGTDVSDRDYFRRAIGNRKFVVSDFFIGKVRKQSASVAALPIFDSNGAPIRVVAVTLDLGWFGHLAAEVGKETGGSVLLVDRQGTLLAGYPVNPEWVGKNFRQHELITRLLAAREGWAELHGLEETRRVYGFVQVPGTSERIAVGFDRSSILDRIYAESIKDGLSLLIVAMTAVLVTIALARNIARPLKLLTAGAHAARDLAAASLPEVRGYAEVRSLAASLNELLDERQKREQALVEARTRAEQAEQHAREAHLRLSAAIEMLPEGIAIFDAEDRFALWNRRYAELYTEGGVGPVQGMRFEDLVRQMIAQGKHPRAIEREDEWLAERLARHTLPESSHEQHEVGDRWLRVEERRMVDGGIIGIWVDITDLKRREASFRLLFESNPLPMWVYDRESLRFLAVNDAAVAHYGYGREQFLTMTILDIRPSNDWDLVQRTVRAERDTSGDRTWEHHKADGTTIHVAIYSRSLKYEGRSAGLTAVIDLTERKQAEDELRRTRAFLDTVVENIPAMLFVKEAKEHRFVLFNRAGEELLGVPRAELIGKNDHDLFPKREADLFVGRDREVLHSGQLQITEEERIHTPHNGLRLLRTKKIAIADDTGEPQYLLGISEDITERKRAEARITHVAHHDAMTGLANRVLLRKRLEEALSRMLERDNRLAVLYVDLDCFKDVNDALGHPVGDSLLRRAAERLNSCVSGTDMVARLGGDEFAIIQDAIDNSAEAGALARRLIEVIAKPFHVEGQELVVTASVGIALAPNDGADPDSLLQYADMALYAAKTDGRRTYRFFEPGMSARLHARRALETDLRAAFTRNEFELYYQPMVDLATADIIGFEALLRWNHPQRGVIAPGDFITVAENIGLIVPLGEWVLRQACAEAVHWPDHMSVAVNLSPVQFKNVNLAQTVIMALASSGLSAPRLELEVTETVLLQENENNLETLHQLRNLGVRIALDDFGIGYSSLSYLRVFPFDRIKIDGSFVKELPHNTECVSIIHAVIGLAKALQMATTAEGVETPEQYEHLKADGCTDAQGFLISRPKRASAIGEFSVQRRRAENAA